jgi:hypothetical protein
VSYRDDELVRANARGAAVGYWLPARAAVGGAGSQWISGHALLLLMAAGAAGLVVLTRRKVPSNPLCLMILGLLAARARDGCALLAEPFRRFQLQHRLQAHRLADPRIEPPPQPTRLGSSKCRWPCPRSPAQLPSTSFGW